MLKQLREDGFAVSGFERRGKVGGLWAYSDDTSYTTALPSELLHLRPGSIQISRSNASAMNRDRCQYQQIHLRVQRLPNA